MSDVLIFDTKAEAFSLPKVEKVKTFKLIDEYDPSLLKVVPDFNFAEPPVNPNEFASTLVETCISLRGLGLAAPQCGYPYRVFVMGSGTEYIACYNPKVIVQSEEVVFMQEGCLSFPNLFLSINRPAYIEVEYQDFLGEKREAKFVGMTARQFQHELDHLNGILFTQRAKPLALQMGQKKRIKKMEEQRRAMKNALKGKNESTK